uniref:Uncharacterized protein n=1 Tax=Anguilla anguilla TaxID=7936 RepID=A0A0E9Q6S2_ANGAN
MLPVSHSRRECEQLRFFLAEVTSD